MYNGICKWALIAATITATAACGNSDTDRAAALLESAQASYDAGDYDKAIVLLDSLDNTFPREVAVRKSGMPLKASAIESLTMKAIPVADSVRCAAQIRKDSLEKLFVPVESKYGLEPYYKARALKTDGLASTTVRPRVSQDGWMYLAVNVNAKNFGLSHLIFKSSDGSTFTTTPIKPDRIIREGESESAVFLPEEIEGLGEWLDSHSGKISVEFAGNSTGKNATLPEDIICAAKDSHHYALALRQLRQSNIEREKLERRLQIARSHKSLTQE